MTLATTQDTTNELQGKGKRIKSTVFQSNHIKPLASVSLQCYIFVYAYSTHNVSIETVKGRTYRMNENNRLRIIPPAKFSCGRTCTPGRECRFTPVLRAVGARRVVSHTVQVEIQMRDRDALLAAVLKMGGTHLPGETHSLFQTTETGFGFKLPGWAYPLVVRADNTIAFDDYHGMWGKTEDIETLSGQYGIEAARQAADRQGWMSYDQQDGSLEITHPSGGTMTVSRDGTVDSVGFIGSACDVAAVIEEALGIVGDRTNKPDYFERGTLSV